MGPAEHEDGGSRPRSMSSWGPSASEALAMICDAMHRTHFVDALQSHIARLASFFLSGFLRIGQRSQDDKTGGGKKRREAR